MEPEQSGFRGLWEYEVRGWVRILKYKIRRYENSLYSM
jgi:hypothetical protein